MSELSVLLRTIITSIVDDDARVRIVETISSSGILYEVTVAQSDVGKIIGKQGRIANALRVVAKAAAAKAGLKITINISNKPTDV